MQKHFVWVLSFLALAALSCGPKINPNEIRIGEFGSLTGAQATFGISTDDGIKLAVDEINAAGGINGKTLKVIAYDDQGKPEEAAVVVNKLITQDKAQVILGEVASSLSLAAAPIAQQNKVPLISPSSTNPKVTQVGDYVFRVCFIDPFQGRVMADLRDERPESQDGRRAAGPEERLQHGLGGLFREAF